MNNKGDDQTVRMRRLVCPFVVSKPPKTGFLMSRPILMTLCMFGKFFMFFLSAEFFFKINASKNLISGISLACQTVFFLFCFLVWFVALLSSKQLWSCREGQFT